MSIEDFESSVFSLELDGHVATLWLDRPEALNAMGRAFWEDLPLAVAALNADPRVRVIVLADKGKHFCAGLDLKEMSPELLSPASASDQRSTATRNQERYQAILKLQAAVSSLANTDKPVIAVVHGSCIGGGVDLIAACDIRLSSADAMYSVREARIAIVADLGSLQRLRSIIGAGHLAELALSAKDIDARFTLSMTLSAMLRRSMSELCRWPKRLRRIPQLPCREQKQYCELMMVEA